jgi:hypothetical protein
MVEDQEMTMTTTISRQFTCHALLMALLAGAPVAAQQTVEPRTLPAGDAGGLTPEAAARAFPSQPAYSPHVNRNFPTRPLFGDTHLHTSFSMDAGAFGARLEPRDAYRFARGEVVMSSTGVPAQLSRPLDFLVVADHSDNMGVFPALYGGDPAVLADPVGKRWYEMIRSGQGSEVAFELITRLTEQTIPPALTFEPGSPGFRGAWEATIAAAEEANEPGRFTAFIGYEWTAQAAINLHRNVIFRDGADLARQVQPFTTVPPLGSPLDSDLWRWMEDYEERTGGRVLAIPHNGNVSNGLMFGLTQPLTDKPFDLDYVEARARFEPVYEVTQMKGDGETHPFLSPNDEFADFERWDKGNLDVSVAKEPDMLQYEYARSALRMGLQLEEEFGTNPFKFGMIGSTDSHTGLPAVEEDNFFGKVTPMEPNPERLTKAFLVSSVTGLTVMEYEVVSSGYAAVWARENTRESIFDAMERRESLRPPVHEWSCVSLAATTSCQRTHRAAVPRSSDTPRACPWGAIFTGRLTGRRQPSLSPRCATRSAPTSTAIRSSRDGWTPRAKRTSRSTTSRGRTTGNPARTASCLRWATRWTSRMPPGPTTLARRN